MRDPRAEAVAHCHAIAINPNDANANGSGTCTGAVHTISDTGEEAHKAYKGAHEAMPSTCRLVHTHKYGRPKPLH